MTKLKKQNNTTVNWYYGGGDLAWASIEEAKENILGFKRKGLTIGVFENGEIVEYYWSHDNVSDDALIPKTTNGNNKIVINGKEFNYFGQDAANPDNGDYAEGLENGKLTLYKRVNEQWEIKQKR